MTEKDKLTEEKIFEAAKTVFAERGMDGARMQEIAALAGINKSLLHYYFRTKEKLFNAVFDDFARVTIHEFAQIFARNLPLEEKIRYFFSEHMEFLKRNPSLPIFILTEINRNPERMKKLIEKIDYKNLWQTMWTDNDNDTESLMSQALFNIESREISQIITSALAISIFPFAARNMLEAVLIQTGQTFDSYIEERKEFAANLILNYLKSKNI